MPTVIKKAVKKVATPVKKAAPVKKVEEKKAAPVKAVAKKAPVKKAAPVKAVAKKAPVKKVEEKAKKGFLGKVEKPVTNYEFKFGCENAASMDQLAAALMKRLKDLPEYSGVKLKDCKLIWRLIDDVLYEAVVENHNKFVLPKSRISAKVIFTKESVKNPPLAENGELTLVADHYEVAPIKKKKLGKREDIIFYGKLSKDGKTFITRDGDKIKLNEKKKINEKDYCEIMKEATASAGKAPAKKKTVKTAAKEKVAKVAKAAAVAEELEEEDEEVEEVDDEIEETTVDDDEEVEEEVDEESEDDEEVDEDEEEDEDEEDEEESDDDDESIFDDDED